MYKIMKNRSLNIEMFSISIFSYYKTPSWSDSLVLKDGAKIDAFVRQVAGGF